MSEGTVPPDCVRRSFILHEDLDKKLNEASRNWRISKTGIVRLALKEFFATREDEIKRAA